MTKIAYLRASQQMNQCQTLMSNSHCAVSATSLPPPPPPPPLPMSGPVMQFQTPRPNTYNTTNTFRPKPTIMAPTTRFNSNPTVICDPSIGGRISKPLMEKRRRARINQCLSQLKQIVVDSAGEYTQSNKCKLEKADILELTVKYVKKLHNRYQTADETKELGYVNGYTDCAQQVCTLLMDMPNVDTTIKESLNIHLNDNLVKLKELEATATRTDVSSLLPDTTNTTAALFCAPPSPAPSSASSGSPTTAANINTTLLQSSPPLSYQSIESDEYEEFEFEDDEEEEENKTIFHYKKLMLPLNLKVNKTSPINSEDEDVWRPW